MYSLYLRALLGTESYDESVASLKQLLEMSPSSSKSKVVISTQNWSVLVLKFENLQDM